MSTTEATSPTSQAIIRPARADDADAVFGLLNELAESYLPDREAFDLTFDAFASGDANALILVAELGGVVRGYVLTTITRLLYTNGSSAHLQELVVESSAQGVGIGSQLVESIERECRARGVRQLTVASRRSAGFYERLGYLSTADFLKRTFD
ncbi:ribosomal protein S18 acetylase RimI-like enzyme [Conyzicola lurida]|uniref:Ribosomal protein S18 acetylase RimI-like enzyme n=1 Tax=Conyzicola lurida TaxID=1172621 RepID=A0A841ANH5_9MICO|nr:GNAT family N-acetyltransferase [Conyzicola lurida]MBB5842969.1 ribosomal protein S18 acetylase RimI-like enzyme [Conyzicola lurida]